MRRFIGFSALLLLACSSAGEDGGASADGDEDIVEGAGGGGSLVTGSGGAATGGGSDGAGGALAPGGGSGGLFGSSGGVAESGGATGIGGMSTGGTAAGGSAAGGGFTGGSSAGGSATGGSSTGGTSTGGSSTGGSSTGGSSTGGTGTGGSDGGDGCPYSGNMDYQLNEPESWEDQEAVGLITAAMDEALSYYNCYADLSHSITVDYNPGVPTAQANVDGWLSFGANHGYMQVATAMHEISHTLGVGYYPWTELIEGGRWTGAAVSDLMQSIPPDERDADEFAQRDYITGDNQHFWPYGLNQASEYQSEWSLINHVRIVDAMLVDKQTYLDEN